MPYSLDINLEDLGKYSFYLTPDSLEILERKRVKITYGKKQGISKEVLGKGKGGLQDYCHGRYPFPDSVLYKFYRKLRIPPDDLKYERKKVRRRWEKNPKISKLLFELAKKYLGRSGCNLSELEGLDERTAIEIERKPYEMIFRACLFLSGNLSKTARKLKIGRHALKKYCTGGLEHVSVETYRQLAELFDLEYVYGNVLKPRRYDFDIRQIGQVFNRLISKNLVKVWSALRPYKRLDLAKLATKVHTSRTLLKLYARKLVELGLVEERDVIRSNRKICEYVIRRNDLSPDDINAIVLNLQGLRKLGYTDPYAWIAFSKSIGLPTSYEHKWVDARASVKERKLFKKSEQSILEGWRYVLRHSCRHGFGRIVFSPLAIKVIESNITDFIPLITTTRQIVNQCDYIPSSEKIKNVLREQIPYGYRLNFMTSI